MGTSAAVESKMTGKTYTMEEIRSVAQEMAKDPDSSVRAMEGVEWFIKPKTYPLLPEPDRGSVAAALSRQRMDERLEHAKGLANTISEISKQREEQKRREEQQMKCQDLVKPKSPPAIITEGPKFHYSREEVLKLKSPPKSPLPPAIITEGPKFHYSREEVLKLKSPPKSPLPPAVVTEGPTFCYSREEVLKLKSPPKSPLPPAIIAQSSPPQAPTAASARWKEGDVCIALWEADGSYYPARVLQVFAGDATAEVVYIGYRGSNAIVELKDMLAEDEVDLQPT